MTLVVAINVLLIACDGSKGNTEPPSEDSAASTTDTNAEDSSPPTTLYTGYADRDGDGYGDPATSIEAELLPEGYVADDQDCDDDDPLVHPEAAESCNSQDDDCDGSIDEDLPTTTLYPDLDGDGWGDDTAPEERCGSPAGYLSSGGDCDDTRAAVYPGAPDICGNSLDDGCTGLPDSRCRPEGERSLSDSGAKYLGVTEGGLAGAAVSCGGNSDDDGPPEMLLSATEEAMLDADGFRGPGGVWLIGELASGEVNLPDVAIASIWGEVPGAIDGLGINFVSDLDHDGYDEIAIGTLLFSGPLSGPLLFSDADARIVPSYPSNNLGSSVTPFGDGQFAVSGTGNVYDHESGWGEDVGSVLIFDGLPSGGVSATTAVATLAPSIYDQFGTFGRSLCSGDLDGDGQADLAIGAPSLASESYSDFMLWGITYIQYGPILGSIHMTEDDTGDLRDADARIEGVATSPGSTGYALSCGGDTDGDGLADLLIGSPGFGASSSRKGMASLFRGPISGGVHTVDEADWAVSGIDEEDYLGVELSLTADLDADGRNDVAVSRYLSGFRGEVHLFYDTASGRVGSSDAAATLVGEEEGDSVAPVSGCPDLDGDGFDDLLIGAGGDSTNGDGTGAAYVVFGGPG